MISDLRIPQQAWKKAIEKPQPWLSWWSQGDKIELDKNNVIYVQGEPKTHTVDEIFDIKAQEVIDFFYYNHKSIQLVCSSIDEFSIDEWSFNLLKLELKHIKHYDFIGVDELLKKNFLIV